MKNLVRADLLDWVKANCTNKKQCPRWPGSGLKKGGRRKKKEGKRRTVILKLI